MNRRAPSRCIAMPFSRAKAEMRFASSQSNICPAKRLIGLSIAIAPTSDATRPPAVRVSTASTSVLVNVARPGASGMSVRPDSVWQASPVSL